MNEKQFVDQISKIIQNELPKKYTISTYCNLIYKLFINQNGEIEPSNIENPVRGQNSFQTDLLIKRGNIPVIVIEAKYGSLTTHDILTYSNKSLKHKEVYPHIRYGLIVGDMQYLPNRFFTHNSGFDFAYATKKLQDSDVFARIIYKQIETYELMTNVLSKRIKKYETTINVN